MKNNCHTSMIFYINVSPSLNCLIYSYRTGPSAIIHRYKIQLSYFEKISCERVCEMYRTALLITISPLVVCPLYNFRFLFLLLYTTIQLHHRNLDLMHFHILTTIYSSFSEPQSLFSTLFFHFHPTCMSDGTSVSFNEHINISHPLGAVSIFLLSCQCGQPFSHV